MTPKKEVGGYTPAVANVASVALREELRQIAARQARIKRLEAEGELSEAVKCPCCGKLTHRLAPNPDGVMVGVDCASHNLGGCRKVQLREGILQRKKGDTTGDKHTCPEGL